ncbi:VCBS repeat-containing protein [Lysobacter sp. 5GHs7-4]|uniref:FG-GAP repeat domain-containing protein n=1 Tax=Lysobacter sp. 5GHs7-4 TaxID=2904253 RepID=UPI001E2842D8|nr:VCBS repeat-containing protein [Lysobacter sp. 5GHs7-4]UHQ22675.1 VCBS repeat-containing protein [Lysobacter sp. 5GHs7-4]
MRNMVLAGIAVLTLSGCPQDSNEVAASQSQAGASPVVARAVAPDTVTARFVAPLASAGGPQLAAATPVGPHRDLVASSLRAASAQTLASVRGAYNDANADGRSDLVWIGEASGSLVGAHWYMQGAQITRTSGPTTLDGDAIVMSTGDFDGDRRVDQLWLTNSGNLSLGRLNEAGWYESKFIAHTDGVWLPHRSADLNGDGKSDIVWINRSQRKMAYWVMDGTRVLRTGVYDFDAANYTLAGVGDFDGDGREDLLWRHQRNHVLYQWRSRSDGHFDQQYVGTVSGIWRLDATPDLNGDSRSDLVWINLEEDQVAYWWMNGATIQRTGVLSADTRNFALGAWGDFDGDGKGDLVWVGRPNGNDAPLYLWRGRGDGNFDSIYIAGYDAGTWQLMPAYADA